MSERESAGTASSGPAVLDIGDGVGALLVIVPAALLHTEIEVSRDGLPNVRIHTGVHERHMGRARLPIALFPSLDAGTWILWESGPCETRTVQVSDGQVARVDWR